MDIHLAGEMDGIEAAGLIRDQYKTPVIFLTAYADDKTIERAKTVGPFGYILKPFRERDLYATIEMAQERARLETELEAANHELDSFSYSVSHDLRAPLIAIDGYSRILEELYLDFLPPDGQQCMSRIREAATHMDQLVSDFLKLSRVGRVDMIFKNIDLSAIAAACFGELARHGPERNVRWTIEPDLVAHGDEGLIRIALQNLISNAWKYTSKQPEATIEMGIVERGAGTAFYIRDNGAGFPPEKADLLFVPLQRLHTQEEFPGTGIGLATVQRIIHRHGGRIWAKGSVGKGAIFYFTLPERV